MIPKIVSGGQTGVDRAALDAALHLGIAHGGWCPKGRRAEDGVISDKYGLKETESDAYEERTLINIRDSNATLILIDEDSDIKKIMDGTKLTIDELNRVSKPYLIAKVSKSSENNNISIEKCLNWLTKTEPDILNVAGPRESTSPGIYAMSFKFLNQFLIRVKEGLI